MFSTFILWCKGRFREDNEEIYKNATFEITEIILGFEYGTSEIYKRMLPTKLILVKMRRILTQKAYFIFTKIAFTCRSNIACSWQ
jgi:hypothetical protein